MQYVTGLTGGSSQGALGDVTVHAHFGDETLKAPAVQVFNNRVDVAMERQGRGVAGGTLSHLSTL